MHLYILFILFPEPYFLFNLRQLSKIKLKIKMFKFKILFIHSMYAILSVLRIESYFMYKHLSKLVKNENKYEKQKQVIKAGHCCAP